MTDWFKLKDRTLAESLDEAWAVYTNPSQTEAERSKAQQFLIHVLDIRFVIDINATIIAAMADRNQHKELNPEYIPGQAPKHLGLTVPERVLQRTTTTKTSESEKINELFKQKELLDVNQNDKTNDQRGKSFFNARQRAGYRAHIYHGSFYSQGKLIDTTSMISHRKNTFAAFTINANGELSIFNHDEERIVHSSMNAGSPVVSAGEIMIKKGKLCSITTYSGHYNPNLFNIFRALEMFVSKGVDISEAEVITEYRPSGLGLDENQIRERFFSKHDGSEPEERPDDFYLRYDYSKHHSFPASHFLKSVSEHLVAAQELIVTDIRNYQADSTKNLLFRIKDTLTFSSLTKNRAILAEEIVSLVKGKLSDFTGSITDYRSLIEDCIKDLNGLKTRNNELSASNGKEENSGRLNQGIDKFIKELQDISDIMPIKSLEQLDTTVVNAMKNNY